jgi:4'-phosphopantetheinyl transferase
MWWVAQGEDHVPAGTDWLSPRERAWLEGIRYTKRHVEFRTRRWTAKRALAAVLQRDEGPAAMATIEVANHISGAPYVKLDGQARFDIEVSISDRAGWAVCLVGTAEASAASASAASATSALGIDLELVEPRSGSFIADFFTAAEVRRAMALPPGEARDEAANLVWSAKEAALKVLKVGLRADTREVEVHYDTKARPDGWRALTVVARDGARFPGWWRRDGVFLLTLAAARPFDPPALLPGGGDLAAAVPSHSWLTRPLV